MRNILDSEIGDKIRGTDSIGQQIRRKILAVKDIQAYDGYLILHHQTCDGHFSW
jgi:hypothetical protein